MDRPPVLGFLPHFAPGGLQCLAPLGNPPAPRRDPALVGEPGQCCAEWRQYLNRESIYRLLMSWLDGNFSGLPAGDVQRMPGAFLLQNNLIKSAFRHRLVSDRPNYLELATAT